MTPLHRDAVLSIPELTTNIVDYLGRRSLCSLRLVSRCLHQACIFHFRIALQHSGPISGTTAISPSEQQQQQLELLGIFHLFPIKVSGHLVHSLVLLNCLPHSLQEERELSEWFSSLVGLESFSFQETSRSSDSDTARTVLRWVQQCPTLQHLRLRLSKTTKDVLQDILLGLGSSSGTCPRLESLSVELRREEHGPAVRLCWEVLMETLGNLPRLSSLSLHGFTVLGPDNTIKIENGGDEDGVGGTHAAAAEEDENESEEKEVELNCSFTKITHLQAFNCSLPKFNLARLFPNVKSLGVFSLNLKIYIGPRPSDLIPSGQSGHTPPLSLDRLSFGALMVDNMDTVLDALRPYRSGDSAAHPSPNSGNDGLHVEESRPTLTNTIKSVALSIQNMDWVAFDHFTAALQDRGIEVREFTFTKGINNMASLSQPCFKNLQFLDVTNLGLQFGTYQLGLDRPFNVQRRGYGQLRPNTVWDGEEAALSSIDATFINSRIPFAHSLRCLHLGAGDFGNGRFAERERSRHRFLGEPRLQDHNQRSATVVLRRILACLPVLEEFSLGTALEDLSLFEGLGRCARSERQGLWGEWHEFMEGLTNTESIHYKGDEEETKTWLKNERPFLRNLEIFSSQEVTKTHKTRISAWRQSLEHRFRFLEILKITQDH